MILWLSSVLIRHLSILQKSYKSMKSKVHLEDLNAVLDKSVECSGGEAARLKPPKNWEFCQKIVRKTRLPLLPSSPTPSLTPPPTWPQRDSQAEGNYDGCVLQNTPITDAYNAKFLFGEAPNEFDDNLGALGINVKLAEEQEVLRM